MWNVFLRIDSRCHRDVLITIFSSNWRVRTSPNKQHKSTQHLKQDVDSLPLLRSSATRTLHTLYQQFQSQSLPHSQDHDINPPTNPLVRLHHLRTIDPSSRLHSPNLRHRQLRLLPSSLHPSPHLDNPHSDKPRPLPPTRQHLWPDRADRRGDSLLYHRPRYGEEFLVGLLGG